MPKIYIVEDDENIRDLVLYALRSADFEVEGFETPEAFREALEGEVPDLVLLDIMLPGEDGISLLQSLKKNYRTEKLPVIMLTAEGSEYDRVMGLDMGADDYLTKPFSVLELVSRIRAVLRRTGGLDEKKEILSCQGVSLHMEKHLVTADGVPVQLTYREFALLQLLMENPERVISRDRIMSAVWGTDFEGETRTIDMHIKTLRQKLGDGGQIIKTVRGVGYKAGE